MRQQLHTSNASPPPRLLLRIATGCRALDTDLALLLCRRPGAVRGAEGGFGEVEQPMALNNATGSAPQVLPAQRQRRRLSTKPDRKTGGPGGIRTHDLRVKSLDGPEAGSTAALTGLSYGPFWPIDFVFYKLFRLFGRNRWGSRAVPPSRPVKPSRRQHLSRNN